MLDIESIIEAADEFIEEQGESYMEEGHYEVVLKRVFIPGEGKAELYYQAISSEYLPLL